MVASPTLGFYGQVALFVASLRALGYSSADAFVRVFLGASCDEDIHHCWRAPLDGVELVWADREKVRKYDFYAQCDDAFAHGDFIAPIVIFCDTDTVWLARIDELLDRLSQGPLTVAGVMAHYPPPWNPAKISPNVAWDDVGRAIIGESLSTNLRYSISTQIAAPFYPNFGFVAMQSELMAQGSSAFLTLAARSAEFLAVEYFKYQIAVPLFCRERNLMATPLSPVFNFVNDRDYEQIYAALLPEAKVIHYLRGDRFDRSRSFSEVAAFKEFLEMPLTGIEQVLQRRVRSLWPVPPAHLE